jgi:L-glyceraldehyde 3-phosphate reductase
MSMLSDENLTHVRALNDIAQARGQKLAQMALAWVLRDSRVTSALTGASSVEQLDENLDALHNLDFSAEELAKIDQHALDAGIDLWRTPATS